MAHRKTTTQLSHVAPQLWRACAGATVHPPTPNSLVYYFPQGHLEQSSSPIKTLPNSLTSRPIILCRVSSVQLLVDPQTDEVFAKLHLRPIADPQNDNVCGLDIDIASFDDNANIESYAKVLTPSDANNGGGFSVPRFCADSIFPKLDYNVEPPLQTLVVTDLHGTVWKFRHIYRGTPRRHLLTTGWSRFVNSKKLIGGDSVIFMRDSRGSVFVGIRRVARPSVSGEFEKWRAMIGGGRFASEEVRAEDAAFGSGKVSCEEVVRAVELASQGLDFEVVYYPKGTWSDFVVKFEDVEDALNIGWEQGAKVKMNVETEDLLRLTSVMGTVQGCSVSQSMHWRNSPWRMLQVSWDEPEATHHPSRVNPWQVEFMGPKPPIIDPTLNPSKKPRLSWSFPGGQAEVFSPMSGSVSATNESNSSVLRSNSIPAGMQGARHSSFRLSSISDTISGSIPNRYLDNSSGKNIGPILGSLSTELNIDSSHSGDLSQSSQSSVQSTAENNSGKKDGSTVFVNSFQLFGQTIICEPIQSPSSDAGDAENEVAKKHAKNGDSGITLDLSLTCPLTDVTNSIGL